MKNILILINTASKDFQTSRTEIIENTWAKDILEGEYPNIRLWHCAPMSNSTR